MLTKSKSIKLTLRPDGARVTGIQRTDRGTKYLGRQLSVKKGEKSREEYWKEIEVAVAHLLDGTEPV